MYATPEEQWTIGAPLCRIVADSIVQFGEEESRGATDAGGKKDIAFLTFLSKKNKHKVQQVESCDLHRAEMTRSCKYHQRQLASVYDGAR